jgi:hypothetical protein
MMYGEIIAVYFEKHTKHENTQCEQNIKFLILMWVVHIVSILIEKFNRNIVVVYW